MVKACDVTKCTDDAIDALKQGNTKKCIEILQSFKLKVNVKKKYNTKKNKDPKNIAVSEKTDNVDSTNNTDKTNDKQKKNKFTHSLVDKHDDYLEKILDEAFAHSFNSEEEEGHR
jgi:hypothetical protein